MTEQEVFQKYFDGGFYSMPLLIKFSSERLEPIYLVNNNENITFSEHVYLASSFEYSPPDTMGKGASLRISGIDNNLIEFIENADDTARLDVDAVIAENGEVEAVKKYHHFMGKVSYNETMELQFELGSDDRLDMTFPPYKFDSDTNRGNV